MKIEFIDKELPPAWDKGRLESTELVIRNLRKVSSDESSSLWKAAQLALNVYDRIMCVSEADRNFSDLALDACGLVYVMIQKQTGLLNQGLKHSRDDKIARHVENIMMDVEVFVLKTVLGHISPRNGHVIADYQQKIEKCLAKYSENSSSGTTIREAVVELVAKKLMDYEDVEVLLSNSVQKGKQKMVDEILKSHTVETSPTCRDAGRRKKGHINPEKSETDSSRTGSTDDSSESEESESSQESGVEITSRKGKGKENAKQVAGNKRKNFAKADIRIKKTMTDRIFDRRLDETLNEVQENSAYHARNTKFTGEPIETRSVSNNKRKNRTNTLSDRHRAPEELSPVDESDEEEVRSNSKHPKKHQPGPHRSSTTPLLHHFTLPPQSRQATSSQRLDDYSGLLNPSFGQTLTNDINSHVMSKLQSSMRMHIEEDDESESLHRRRKGKSRTENW